MNHDDTIGETQAVPLSECVPVCPSLIEHV